MKVVDIKKGRTEFEKKLSRLRQSLEFKEFIALLAECLRDEQFDIAPLHAFWQENKDLLAATDYLLEALPIVSNIEILYPSPRYIRDADLPTHASDSAIKFCEAMEAGERLRDPFREKYSWFFPSHCIAPLLEESYPEELDPGRIIARHLQLFFPEEYPEEYQMLIHGYPRTPAFKIAFSSPEWHLLIELAAWMAEKTVGNEQQRACSRECLLDLLDPENRAGRSLSISVIEKLLQMYKAPPELFHAWIWSYFIASDEDGSLAPKLSTAEFKAALLTLSFGDGTSPLALDPAFSRFNGVAAIKTLLSSNKRLIEGKYLSWEAFYSLLYRAAEDEVILDVECHQLLQALMCSFTKFRQTYLGGVSPLLQPYMFHNLNGFFSDAIGVDCADLLQLLADGDFDGTFLNLINEKVDCSYTEQVEFYNERQSLYLQLVTKANAVGLYELGTALLSIYLLHRMFFFKCRLNLSSDMLKALSKALESPGSRTLKLTLELAVASAEEYFSADPVASSSALVLRQFVPQGAQLKVFPGKIGQDGTATDGAKQVRDRLQGYLGAERWNKLSENSRNFLISAELQWCNNYREFCFGINDWSGLITTYCKAVEGELVDRLADFYACSEYEAYLMDKKGLKRPAKATAGWLLKELKSYESMPKQLQGRLNSAKIRIAGDTNLVNRLYEIFQKYRNISAHHDAVSSNLYSEFRGKLFEGGLLIRFIDAFDAA